MKLLHPLRLAGLAATAIVIAGIGIAVGASATPLAMTYGAIMLPLLILLYLLPMPAQVSHLVARCWIFLGWAVVFLLGCVVYAIL